jgi:hypothetical protein
LLDPGGEQLYTGSHVSAEPLCAHDLIVARLPGQIA